jgi:5-methylcytosine-specific restriction endonuclease McrA
MPVRPENRGRYPKDWKAMSFAIKAAVGWRCEWCPAQHGKPHPITGSMVVLTIAHLDHTPENCDRANLKALCQKCHNTYDAAERRRGREQRKQAAIPTRAITEIGLTRFAGVV